MSNLLANALLAVNFTTYPALGDRPPAAPREVQATAQVEAMFDRGPIVEMIYAARAARQLFLIPRSSGAIAAQTGAATAKSAASSRELALVEEP